MQIITTLDPAQIEHIRIANECMETYPCMHRCDIEFKNGTKHIIELSATKIYSCIEKLPPNKIHSSYPLSHFKCDDLN